VCCQRVNDEPDLFVEAAADEASLIQAKLPPAFGIGRADHLSFCVNRWVYRANKFRELVEPFDIAKYYRLELDRDWGHYLHGGNRPHIYTRLENMWRQFCRCWNPPPATFRSSVAWAEAMLGVRTAPERAAAAAGSAVQRLPLPVLPAGMLPLVHRAL
jgi:Enhanced disease susceptibility 1 protein EP domain